MSDIQPQQTTTPRSLSLNARLNRWHLLVLLIAFICAVPVLTVFSYVFQPAGEVWQHLTETVLSDYVVNSLILMIGVSFGTLTMGISCAWLTSVYKFPGRKLFQWLLLLPMALPAYIIAYTYTGMMDFTGPIQSSLRELFGWSYGDYWFPEIRSIWGATSMLSLVLYPYVYLLARAAFLEQSIVALEASRSLGAGPWKSFFQVALPMARPAIITGLSLVLMETLADYGTVQYFGISTFTTGIFRTWFGLNDSAAAAQLSSLLLVFVLILITLERISRKQARYFSTSNREKKHARLTLSKNKAWLATLACLMPVLWGFFLPFLQLTQWAFETYEDMVDREFFVLAWNSLSLAGSAAILALLLALLLAYGQRLQNTRFIYIAVRVASMGYAIPATVIAVGIMLPLAWIDNTLDSWLRSQFDVSSGLLLSGTLFALMFAYMIRFLAVSVGTVEAALGKIKHSMDDAARSLGLSPKQVLLQIHMPLMRRSLLTAILLVFVDVLKELPATLILRPFNFNTLAVRAYELASDERLADASSAALSIVIAGIIPVILLSRSINKQKT
ncbi:MAG: iron ABC transporter permease [Gammaproteobacteria bacterium]|nr:iron ABC transporter permease [Gammaproteobacteria bacterium]